MYSSLSSNLAVCCDAMGKKSDSKLKKKKVPICTFSQQPTSSRKLLADGVDLQLLVVVLLLQLLLDRRGGNCGTCNTLKLPAIHCFYYLPSS